MSEPVSIRYKCKFCGNQQNKSLRSGPPNPGVCLKAPEDGKGWHGPQVGSRAALSPHLISGIHLRKQPRTEWSGLLFLGVRLPSAPAAQGTPCGTARTPACSPWWGCGA